jgi:ABC-type branched-subunit amino acid transport system ATPase component
MSEVNKKRTAEEVTAPAAEEICETNPEVIIAEIRDKYKLTVFLIEHHMDLVMNISDYIYVIDFGSEIAQGVPEEVQSNQKVIEAYLGVAEEDE